jgi:hypothetical protein
VLGLCFVVTLSQFKKGFAYLRESNPLVDEKNLFFAHKKYDRSAQLLHVCCRSYSCCFVANLFVVSWFLN